jgi:chemotaxis protein histidine kinase CheA
LGLAITRRLLALLGGSVDVKSEFGKGSVFTVILPVNAESAQNVSIRHNDEASHADDQGPSDGDISEGTVLVAEDR